MLSYIERFCLLVFMREEPAVISQLLPQWSVFELGPIRVKFVQNKVAPSHFFFRVLRFSHVGIIPPLLCTDVNLKLLS